MKFFFAVTILLLSLCYTANSTRYAVSILYPNNSTVSGLIAFQQKDENSLTQILATIRELPPLTKHGIHIHMNGDLTNGCTSAGAHYNPLNMTHGSIRSEVRHIGDLSNIIADANGNVHMRAYTDQISLFGEFSIVGRAVVVHAKEDDLGKGGDAQSLKTGNAGGRPTCGVVGLTDSFKNVKP